MSKSIEGLSLAGKDLLPGLTSESSPQDLVVKERADSYKPPSDLHTCTHTHLQHTRALRAHIGTCSGIVVISGKDAITGFVET